MRVSSPFGVRVHPVTGQRHMHNGADLRMPVGTVLVAPSAGVVAFAGPLPASPASGIALGVDHDDGRHSWSFSHLSGVLVRVGDRVSAGAPVALSGATGLVTGPHLHLVVRVDGAAVDPMPFFAGVVGALAIVAGFAVAFV